MKLTTLEPRFVDQIPVALEEGILYFAMRFDTASHLCACGCGTKVVTPLGIADWTLTYDGEVSLRPSVGNGQLPCRSHYLITDDAIQWLPRMSAIATSAALRRDRSAHHPNVEPTPGFWRRMRRQFRWSGRKKT